mmetsp:Transcript_6617/g.19444  ORF Transcript_6617/g.19444 Transcript_6617/m.19444 type:complete len:222 (-) Transcript_6617:19-684(-)
MSVLKAYTISATSPFSLIFSKWARRAWSSSLSYKDVSRSHLALASWLFPSWVSKAVLAETHSAYVSALSTFFDSFFCALLYSRLSATIAFLAEWTAHHVAPAEARRTCHRFTLSKVNKALRPKGTRGSQIQSLAHRVGGLLRDMTGAPSHASTLVFRLSMAATASFARSLDSVVRRKKISSHRPRRAAARMLFPNSFSWLCGVSFLPSGAGTPPSAMTPRL